MRIPKIWDVEARHYDYLGTHSCTEDAKELTFLLITLKNISADGSLYFILEGDPVLL